MSHQSQLTIGCIASIVQLILMQGVAFGLHQQSLIIRTDLNELFRQRLGLQRLRSVANLPGNLAVCDVFVQVRIADIHSCFRYSYRYLDRG